MRAINGKRAAGLGSALLFALASSGAGAGDWQYRVSPYVWVASLTGDLGADGVQGSTSSDYSFFALENLQGYASVHFDAHAAKWGWFVDGLYVDFGDVFQRQLVSTSLGLTGRIYEAGGLYQLAKVPGLAVLVGGRRIDVEIAVGFNPGPDGDADVGFTDPFVGVQYTHPFGGHWFVDARGDWGGFGGSSKSQAQWIASGGYRFSEHLTAFGGYRFLRIDFEDARALMRLTAAGPGFGFSWSW